MLEPQPHWLIPDWLCFVQPALPGEDKATSPYQKSFRTSTNSYKTEDANGGPPVSTAPHGVEARVSLADRQSLIGWGSLSSAAPGEDKSQSLDP